MQSKTVEHAIRVLPITTRELLEAPRFIPIIYTPSGSVKDTSLSIVFSVTKFHTFLGAADTLLILVTQDLQSAICVNRSETSHQT